MRRPDVPLHPFGWATLAAGVGCLLVGLVTRWWELRLVGVFALLLVAIALAFTLGRPAYRVTVQLQDGSVRALDYQQPPQLSIGEYVRVEGNQIFRR